MLKRKRKKEDPLDYITLPKLDIDPEIKKSIGIIFIVALGVISFLGLLNMAGAFGEFLSSTMVWLFGWGRWVFPFLLLVWGWLIYNKEKYEVKGINYFGLFLFLISFYALFHFFIVEENWDQALLTGDGGGHVGWALAATLYYLMGFWASLIVIICLILVSLMFIFNTTLANILAKGSWPARFLLSPFKFLVARRRGRAKEEPDENEETENSEAETESTGDEETENEATGEEDEEAENDNTTEEEADENEEAEPEFGKKKIVSLPPLKKEALGVVWKQTHVKIDLPINLLNQKVSKPTSGDIKLGLIVIKNTLEKFGIPVEMGDISVGPTVTQYTLKPAEGIKLSRITALNNDLSMALAAHPVRIEAPIPGKALVGIEVPNRSVAVVGLSEILDSQEFRDRKNNSMIALGKDVAGKVWLDNLCKMPHLLVAGQTGSGKSVMLNTIIVSLLYQNNPDDLRFIMVDPKRVELTIYNGIPHLLTPVITEVSKTINALKWCLNEMDRRFETLSKVHKRDIDSYNKDSKDKMPYIVFIIDELADLMIVAAKDIEAGIVRLAQMARAVGIHLILATQRPSVNVITGTIKANMPARIAFSVASGIDSRTILDSLGAEKLLGRGDMLFTNATMSKPKRIQGAFVGDQEIKKIVSYIKDKSDVPQYIDEIVERQKVHGVAGVGMDGGSDDDDELLEQAKELVINSGKASASLLQRRLSVGYARAARLLDILEDHGIIGQSNGAKAREILISKEQYEAMLDQGVSGVNLHKQDESVAPENYLPNEEEEEEGESIKSKVHKVESDNEEETEEEEIEEVEENEKDDEEIKEENDKEEKKEEEKEDEKEDNKPAKNLDDFTKLFAK